MCLNQKVRCLTNSREKCRHKAQNYYRKRRRSCNNQGVPVSFDPTFRRFGLRKIKDCYVVIDKSDSAEDMVSAEHDPMAELR